MFTGGCPAQPEVMCVHNWGDFTQLHTICVFKVSSATTDSCTNQATSVETPRVELWSDQNLNSAAMRSVLMWVLVCVEAIWIFSLATTVWLLPELSATGWSCSGGRPHHQQRVGILNVYLLIYINYTSSLIILLSNRHDTQVLTGTWDEWFELLHTQKHSLCDSHDHL